jgi:hypothetical protein
MKLILEEQQLKRVIQKIAESSSNRSLLSLRKAGVGSIFPKSTILNNPDRFRPYERERAGFEEADLENNWYTEDNSDDQM